MVIGLDQNISKDLIKTERLRGARMSVYFRWIFIVLIGILLLIQASLGHKGESVHGFTLIIVYLISNLGLWIAVRRQYDPPFLGYLSALLDVGIICYHLYYLTSSFDHLATTAAATTFLLPVIFLLYTFRLDRYLLFFLIAIAVIGFNFVYFIHYFETPHLYAETLSLSPTSHLFKTAYIFFIGVLCVYFQYVMSQVIKKQVAETSGKLQIDSKLKLEEEKHRYSLELIEAEKQLNKSLEEEIRAKELITHELNRSREEMHELLSNLVGAPTRCLNDDKWTVVFTTQRIEDITGYSPEEFMKMMIFFTDIIVSEDQIKLKADIDKALKQKQHYETEYRIRHKNGSIVWVQEKGKGIFDDSGNLLWLDGVITDITHNKAIENELKENRELIQSLILNLVGAASRCLFDDNLTSIYHTDKIEVITGYPASDFINNAVRSFASIIHPDDDEHCREKVIEAIGNKTHYEFEYRIIHKSGKIVWVYENGQPVFDEKGNVVYLDGITTDITEKKNSEAALRVAEEKFKKIVETSPVAISFANKNGDIAFVNEMFTKMFGYTKDDVPNFDIYFKKIYQDDEYREQISTIWKETIESAKNNDGFIKPHEIIMTCKDGTKKHVVAYTALLEESYLAMFNDITELKTAEMSLSNAKAELELLNKDLEKGIVERTAQLTAANTQLLKLQKENLQSQFEVLKQQVNPHFLFNSLNVLTSLIKVDPDLAETFTERLSKVYRYVLENKDKDMVTLSTEMDFLRAYVFLIDIRFKDKVFVNIKFNEADVEGYVVPLALQLLIENAIKHNTFSKKSPLHIEMFVDDNNYLNVINNLQNRETHMTSTGVGLINISKRYNLLSELEPLFEKTDTEFTAKIPLIKKEVKRNENE